MAIPFSDLQAVAPSAVIELFQLELNTLQHGTTDTYYFHAGTNLDANGDIIWNGQQYLRYPIEATEFEYSGTGQLPRPKLRVSNIFGTITAILLSLPSGLEGAKVTRIRTLARYIDGANFPGGTNPLGTPDPTAEFPREIYYVDRKATETRDLVEFELAAVFDLAGVRAPKRQCVSNLCQWRYKSAECGYAGNAYFDINDNAVAQLSQDVCGKRLRSCELRFAQQRFTGTVTSGSNILTLTQSPSLSTGDPVTGFGLPAATTVSSISGTQVTLNNNAVASTTATTTGTIQTNLTQIVVSSAAGLISGMAVSGNYLPANTQITAISGTTVSLSSLVSATNFLSVVTTAVGYPDPYFAYPNFQTVENRTTNTLWVAGAFPTGPAVGQYVSSVHIAITTLAYITGVRLVHTNFGYYTGYDLSSSYIYTNYTGVTWTFYSLAAIPSATYTFTATDQTYTFRANATLPFGSFPGIGTFST